ncbi:thymidylate synthase [Lampropedia aestuarii]|uniref:thymidylate synthase n=1 Tax=Lampropedia aestuarii TaxID=2562762 RepID=UPI0024695909|nr:thymidylate synthase [Lampropedia aestuarii]MDH5857788.1 thymidylate synthase [Lampropedia aestuarii]
MIVIRGLSPNEAYRRLLALATQHDWPLEASRVGPCRDLGAVTVELDGGERTIFLSGRGWNPAFAVVEAAWIVSGRNDVKPLKHFIGSYDRFSDDGQTLHGAYGYRLRHHFKRDQIEAAIDELATSPESRRVVMTLFAPNDLGLDSKDIPCNTQVTLRRVRGRLEMTVSNRSNDLWLGVPYNWFVFRVLQHFIADRLGIVCGVQRHVSSYVHLYEKDFISAKRVVTINRKLDLERKEAELSGLDMQGVLRDVSALTDLSFNSLTSTQLIGFFTRFQSYRSTNSIGSEILPARDILTESLDQWNLDRHLARDNNMTQPLTYNPETETGLQIQQWVFATPVDAVVERLNVVAQEAMPILREALRSELGQGLRIEFEDAASERQAAMHFVLELVFGTLDPALVRTPIGDILHDRLTTIATSAGLPQSPLRVRELSDEQLKYLFGAILA